MASDSEFLRNTLLPIAAIFGAVTGLAGTVMGVINLMFTWRTHNTDLSISMRLAVTKHGDRYETIEPDAEITNRSYFPVTICAVGYIVRTGLFRTEARVVQCPMPERIESRDVIKVRLARINHGTFTNNSGVFLFDEHKTFPAILTAKKMYVETVTGKRFTGRGGHFKAFLKFVREFHDEQQIGSPTGSGREALD